MNKRKIIVTSIGLGLLFGTFWLSGFLASQKEEPKKMSAGPVIKYVKTSEINYSTVKTEITAYGRVRTAQTLDMISEVSGRMIQGSVPLKEGQNFRKGQLLFKVDDEEARLNLQSQKSNFLRDIASILPDMKIDFSDNYEAWNSYFNSIDTEKDLPDLPAYTSSKEKTFLATRNILSTFYSIKSQESRLKKHNFYAPFSGNIYSINLYSGSYVNPGSNIGRLIRSDRQELKVDISADDIDWIEKGTQAQIVSENGNSWVGTVSRIGEFVNQNTQSIDVFLTIEKGTGDLYDGQFLKATMPSRPISNGMIIPRNIIFNQDEVFVVNDTVLEVRKIKIHKLNEETAVFSGIEEGHDLVIEPLVNAYNGMVVKKLEEKEEIDVETGSGLSSNTAPASNSH